MKHQTTFWRAGLQLQIPGLRRDIVIALTVKLVLLAALFALFFAPRSRPPPDPATTAAALLGQAPELEKK